MRADPPLSAWVGTWRGQVTGDDGPYDVEVELVAAGDALRGNVAYPELECGGDWTQTRQSGVIREFEEVITYQGTCIELGRVRLTYSGETLSYQYTSTNSTRSITATLRRESTQAAVTG